MRPTGLDKGTGPRAIQARWSHGAGMHTLHSTGNQGRGFCLLVLFPSGVHLQFVHLAPKTVDWRTDKTGIPLRRIQGNSLSHVPTSRIGATCLDSLRHHVPTGCIV